MNEKRIRMALRLFPLFIAFLFVVCAGVICLRSHRQTAFAQISAFSEQLLEANPELEQTVLSAAKEYVSLTNREIKENQFLSRYGYRPEDFRRDLFPELLLLFSILFLCTACVFLFSSAYGEKRNRKRIAELTDYLERVNTNADGTILQTREDAFSHLQDELYKTVTSLYQTRENAVAAKKRFAENLANIAHQLKTPITGASLSLQLLASVPDAHTEQMKKHLQRLTLLEEALLTLSRIDAGTLPLSRTEVDIYTALCLAAENLETLLQKNQISVEIPDKGCVVFFGDMEWTMEALMNLMKNCMEYARPGSVVHCGYSENPLYAEISIWDEGPGFDPEDLPHLFERFYRGRHAAGNGIGIGLALARSIFELQNGTLSARNLPEGGACFEIRLYRH